MTLIKSAKDSSTIQERTFSFVSGLAANSGLVYNDPNIISELGLKTGATNIHDIQDVTKAVSKIIRNNNKAPYFYRTSLGVPKVEFVDIEKSQGPRIPGKDFINPRVMLLEIYAITSYVDDYGAGKIVSTFSLLPNEKTKLTLRTWSMMEATEKQARSMLESKSFDISRQFEQTLEAEITNRDKLKETTLWRLPEASADIGIPEIVNIGFSVKGGPENSTEEERETTIRNAVNATSKHVENAAAKREIKVETSFERKITIGREDITMREVENVNAGRVLNFIFRQLQQQYITYVHLIDVRLAFVYSHPDFPTGGAMYREYTLTELEDFLEIHFKDSAKDESRNNVNPRDEVRNWVVQELIRIPEYKRKEEYSIIECVNSLTGKVIANTKDYLDASKRLDQNGNQRLYLRVAKHQFYQDIDPRQDNYEKHMVDGIIMAKNYYILPTDSVLVESLLGQAESLDKYSIESRKAIIDLKRTNIEKMHLAKSIVNQKDEDKADIFEKVYPQKIKVIQRKVEE